MQSIEHLYIHAFHSQILYILAIFLETSLTTTHFTSYFLPHILQLVVIFLCLSSFGMPVLFSYLV